MAEKQGHNPIRVATALLSGRIFAGRPTKDGMAFKEPRYDVTSDVLKAVVDYVRPDHEVTVTEDGKPMFTITVRSIRPTGEDSPANGAPDAQ